MDVSATCTSPTWCRRAGVSYNRDLRIETRLTDCSATSAATAAGTPRSSSSSGSPVSSPPGRARVGSTPHLPDRRAPRSDGRDSAISTPVRTVTSSRWAFASATLARSWDPHMGRGDRHRPALPPGGRHDRDAARDTRSGSRAVRAGRSRTTASPPTSKSRSPRTTGPPAATHSWTRPSNSSSPHWRSTGRNDRRAMTTARTGRLRRCLPAPNRLHTH